MTESTKSTSSTDYDVVVIGSGFGGSVSALRLSEKGYRVGVLEAGRRFADDEFAKTSWDLKKYIFAPAFGLFGIQRINLLRNILVISGAGVGGGSLVYGNTLYEPPQAFYDDPHWSGITDWRSELAPHYDQAKRMLGVARYTRMTPADDMMLSVAAEMGIEHTFTPTDVGVVLGDVPGADVGDPYFGGAGPARNNCLHCGECMTGCRHNAKNTTVKNYLYLAEAAGAVVHPLTTVTDVRPRPGGGYLISTNRSGRSKRHGREFSADQVIFSAAALGTQKLLHRLRDSGSLPKISKRLGELARTNSEAGLAVRARGHDVDFSEGVAITSSIHLDEHTHAEPCRYGRGSNAMGLAMATMTDPVAGRSRLRVMASTMWKTRRDLPRLHNLTRWSEHTVCLLVMQSFDNSLTTFTRRRRLGRGRVLTTRQGIGEPNPTTIPQANELARKLGEVMDGIPAAGWSDAFDIPATGHFLGGCPVGLSAETGVVDPYHRLHGYDGLHVIDGSTVAANLGVNPSLTITAMAERATSMWPNKGEADARPATGAAYRPVEPIRPVSPAVPDGAPAALPFFSLSSLTTPARTPVTASEAPLV